MRSDFTKAETEVLKWLKKVQQEREKNMLKISPLDKTQIIKVVKALVYAFASGFVGTLALLSIDFIHAAIQGVGPIFNLAVALVVAATIGGLNGVAVFVKQLFTPVGR